uniref:Uncharacterized protein n=1 Tax=Oryza barthii TaxID=65489 RepID=A0A0D3ELG5_9ORYZ
MADQANQLSYKAGEAAGHAQARREEAVEKAHGAASAAQEGAADAAHIIVLKINSSKGSTLPHRPSSILDLVLVIVDNDTMLLLCREKIAEDCRTQIHNYSPTYKIRSTNTRYFS